MPVLLFLTPWLNLPFAHAADVTVSGPRYLSLQEAINEPPAPPPPWLYRADVDLAVGDRNTEFVARYRIRSPDEGWLKLTVAQAAHDVTVRFNGEPVPTTSQGDATMVAFFANTDGELRVSGKRTTAYGEDLGLLRVPGRVQLRGPAALSGAVALGQGEFWVNGSALVLTRPPDRPAQGTLILGDAAVGLTVRDVDAAFHTRLRWRIVRGSGLDEVRFTLPGATDDLDLVGRQIARWSRNGDRITVTLNQRATSLVTIEAQWSARLSQQAESSLSTPVPQLEGTFRTTQALQLARDSTHEVVPQVTGFTPLPSRRLPDWATGLVQGQATAAFTSDAPPRASVSIYRVNPAQGPATLVDVAQYTLATSQEGRVLIRAHYAVRNDRGAFLRLTPPPCSTEAVCERFTVLGARVGEQTAKLSRDGDAWLIPLARSVETLQGLLTFPVEVTLIGETAPWKGRQMRGVDLPSLDAPIAVSRATVHLPPAYLALKPRSTGIVEQFTEGSGITYGFATGDARIAQAEALFQGAVDAWMDNSFEEAQALIDDLEALGGDNENVQRLKSNLAYVNEGEVGSDVAQARRVKELARARADKDVVEQQAAVEKAEQKFAEGAYEEAEVAYQRAWSLGNKLGKIAADEDTEVQTRNEELKQKLDTTRKLKKKRPAPSKSSAASIPAPASPTTSQAKAEPPPEPVTEEPDPELDLDMDFDEPESLGEETVVVTGVLLSRRRPQSRSRRSGRRAPLEPPADPTPATSSAPLTVTASSLSVVVPHHGEPIRYQRLLLPADAADAVPVRARPQRRNR